MYSKLMPVDKETPSRILKQIIPSSFYKCKIYEEAGQKGGRYERLGLSLYIDGIKMLIETPRDIAVACNRQRISEVKHLSISHSDPDHVRGIQIVEKIGCDFNQRNKYAYRFLCPSRGH